MARLVVVEFLNNDEADRFVDKLAADHVAGKPRRAIGSFPTPTKFCACDPHTRKSGRTTKFGWWVCLSCKLAQPGWQAPKNLLQPQLVSFKEQAFWVHARAGWELPVNDPSEAGLSFYAFADHRVGDRFPVHKPRNASKY